MKKLLFVCHTPSKNTQKIADAICLGVSNHTDTKIAFTCQSPFQTKDLHLQETDGLILLTTENFGYMSGALKDLFDRTYYNLIDCKRGLPYALVVRAGNDGTGTKQSVERITTGLGWKKVQDALILKGEYTPEFTSQAQLLGEAFAVGLSEGMF